MRTLCLHTWRLGRRKVFPGTCLLLLIGILLGYQCFIPSHMAYAASAEASMSAATDCGSSSASPNAQSLLIVLLDRSGSLIEGNAPTDPNGYSTSVTKALADLWLGQMAVIPFSGDSATLPILGPSSGVSLKNQIQETAAHIGGATPLAPAMQEALNLLQKKGNPRGSRVIIITDGNPTGANNLTGPDQEQQIREQLIPQFCQRGIPVSAFGLEINASSQDGQDANSLLTDITDGTNATYTNVTSPEQLSQVVISLYAQWQGLNFVLEQVQGGNFYVNIDNLAQQAMVVTFRSSSQYAITLTDPDGRPITSPQATDAHYEIDNLDTSGPLLGGTYTVNVDGDPHAQVYALVKSSISLRLLQPTANTRIYANQPVQIQAEFLNGSAVLTPRSGDGQIIATVTLLVNGQQVSSNDVVLTAQGHGAIFSGKTVVFHQPGQLHIELQGNYQQGKLQLSFNLSLLQVPPGPCNIQCQIQSHKTVLIVGGLVLLLFLLALVIFLLLLRRSQRPKLEGYITTGRPGGDLNLTDLRKVRMTSIELETQGNFDFGDARFELFQQPVGGVLIRTLKENVSKVCIDGNGSGSKVEVTGTGVEIRPSNKIYIDGKAKASASYEAVAGKKWV